MLIVWALSWLPGLLLFAYRVVPLLGARRLRRAAIEGVTIVAVPATAWGLYLRAQSVAMTQAGRDVSVWADAASVAQVAVPYVVCAAVAWLRQRRPPAAPSPHAWWLAAAAGAAAVPLLVPGLFMALLMVLFGG